IIEKRMGWAWELQHCFAGVLEAYREGVISEQHAKVITDAGAIIGLGSDTDASRRRASYVEQVLAHAVDTSPSRLRPIARRVAEQFTDVPLEMRHEEARSRRAVFIRDADDGMADLVAHLPAVQAYG